MGKIVIDMPDALPAPLGAGEVLLAAAAKLFELGRLSSGAAAQLAGMPRVEVLRRLGELGVSPFQISEEELRREMSRG